MKLRKVIYGLCLVAGISSCTRGGLPESPVLRVLTHDSFVSKHGLGPIVEAEFLTHCHAPIEWRVAGDAGQIVDRLKLAGSRGVHEADVLIGVDQLQWDRVREFVDTRPLPGFPSSGRWVKEVAEFAGKDGFVPYDFGLFGWIADVDLLSKKGLHVPTTWKELTDSRWKKQLLLEDPRTSTPGFAWVALIHQLFGEEESLGFWRRLRPSILTFTPGWDQAYGLFLDRKAPLVWSYLTSQAYHRKEDPASRSKRAVVLDDASLIQVEGAAVIAGTKKPELARCLMEVLVSDRVQSALPETQWMWPVREGISLPPSFADLPRPKKIVNLRPTLRETNQWVDQWRASQ